MTKIKKKFGIVGIIILLAICLLPFRVMAYDVQVDGISYNIYESTNEAEVTYSYFQSNNNYKGVESIHIPSKISISGKEYSVTSIGRYAFYYAPDLKYVSMDVGIKQIETLAFYGCNSLQSIIFPDNLEALGDYAFAGCSGLQSIVLPEGLETIGSRVFQNCSLLTYVEFPSTLKQIGSAIFLNSTPLYFYLTDLASWCDIVSDTPVFKDALKIYVNRKEITRLEIPEGVKTIRSYAFAGMTCISSVSFPKSLNTIELAAFDGCKFNDVYIEDLASWCNVKKNHDSIYGFFCNGENLYLGENLVTDLNISQGIEKIEDATFRGFSSIKNVTMGENIKKIGSYCFASCNNLQSVNISAGSTSMTLGEKVFSGDPVSELTLNRVITANSIADLQSLENVYIGEIEDCSGLNWQSFENLKTITVEAITPPKTQKFSKQQYSEVTVTIPPGSEEAYYSNLDWAPFWVIMPESIELDPTSLTLKVGESEKLSVEFYPSDTEQRDLTWSSSNLDVADIDENGIITAKSVGSSTITATTVNNLTANCLVTVMATPEYIEFSNTDGSIELNIGEKFKIEACVFPEDSLDNELEWESENPDIVTVDNGTIVGLSPGNTVINAKTSNGVNAKCDVTVDNEMFEVKFEPDTLNLYYWHSADFKLVVNAKNVTKNDFKLSSKDESIVTVLGDSAVFANERGKTEIYASYQNKTYAECSVSVSGISIKVDADSVYMLPTGSIDLNKFEIQYKPDNSDLVSRSKIYWKINDPKDLGYLKDNGELHAYFSTGNITAYACCDVGNYRWLSNPVTVLIRNFTISTPDSITMIESLTQEIKASIGSSWNTTSSPNTKWTSSDPSIVEIVKENNGSCSVHALKEGVVIVTGVVSGGAKSSTIVTVEKRYDPESIELNYSSLYLNVGETLGLEASVMPENAIDKTVTWSSSDKSVSTVNNEGIVTAVSQGEATITATTSNGLTAECRVTVLQPVTGITLNISETKLSLGKTIVLKATIIPENASDKTITWSSSDESVAAVDNNGLVTAVSSGVCAITATTSNGLSATCDVTVGRFVERISIEPKYASGEIGTSLQLEAVIMPEDADNKEVIWSSSDEDVAIVSSTGCVTIVGEGECDIYADTTDGSNRWAYCCITGTSGVESIFADSNTTHDIYTVTGILIKKDATVEYFNFLPKGIYIINNVKVYKNR